MRRFFVLVIVISLVSHSIASLPQIKSYDKQKDLINGQLKGISIKWDGELLLAPFARQIFNSERLFIWDFVADIKGNLFVATGDGAKIYHISPDGKTNMISEWENVEVYSLALDNRGILYAGTSPDGKIYRIRQNNQPEIISNLNVKYIWDIIFDKQNRCYVATGDSGAIYVIDDKGNASIFYKSDETHIRCLTWDSDNQLLAGSYQNGYLYRINSQGQAFVVYDSEYQEIHKICVAKDGTIYIAGLGEEKPKPKIIKEPDKDVRSGVSIDVSSLGTISSHPVTRPKISKSGVIKIQPNGVIKNIWHQNIDQVQSIGLLEDQTLLAGTGDKGRLFNIDAHDETTYLLNFDASQIVSVKHGITGKIWIATSNLGKIFQLEPEFEKKGIYESEVFDAQTLTHWGSLQWDEQIPSVCSIKLYNRSGNTEKPNSTWSPWIKLNKDEGIKSPKARFIQWKLELSTKRTSYTPKIKNIKLSYLQQNLPPEIFSITVHAIERQTQVQPIPSQEPSTSRITVGEEAAVGVQKPTPPPTVRRQLRNGYRRVTWKSQDKNNDQLVYGLYCQEKNEENWWKLKKDLTRTSYTWDTRMMPDGNYHIKVIADDRKSNPINTAKQTEKISDWFIVDNTGPRIEASNAKKIAIDSLQISFAVIDELSPIKQVQISYDMQKWLWVYPQDLVCDSKKENFQFNIKWKQNQYYSIIIKAKDNAENISYGRISVKE
ncbi:MAG: hypothetical protein JSW07_14990 [bacterium]|nr:MAG: hypothetical protein JSW07_14990 [bacterium]